MPKPTRPILPTREPGQYSENMPNYLFRIIPQFSSPDWFNASRWRAFVRNQPIATICRDTLISNINSLDWIISPKEPNMRDELKTEIDYYTELFQNFDGLDFAGHIEALATDLLDLPFGAASEVGREGDKPEGKVKWVLNLDGGTLAPTLNTDFPVMQRIPQAPLNVVYFPKHAISRVYMSPKPELARRGWGTAPPEKIYLAMELLNRGDSYYANLLLDVPEAGILDLGDMSKESASDWVTSFRDLMAGQVDSFKIPVLYEHNTKANFISFTRPPTDIMFDRISMKYASMVCAGYGMTVGDIGLSTASTSGDTLAGTIRGERKTRRTGLATLKKKLIAYFNAILPKYLEFKWIDFDDEVNINQSRARLANATAAGTFIDKKIFTPLELRQQMIADGIMTIPMEEEPNEEDFPKEPMANPTDRRPGLLSNSVPSSEGGHGEITPKAVYQRRQNVRASSDRMFEENLDKVSAKASVDRIERLARVAMKSMFPKLAHISKNLTKDEIVVWNDWYDEVLFGNNTKLEVEPIEKASIENTDEEIEKELDKDDWWALVLSSLVLAELYKIAYENALESVLQEAFHDLYMKGFTNSPDVKFPVSIKNNTEIVNSLLQLSKSSIENIDNGTKFYLRRIVMSKVKSLLTSAEITSQIEQGLDIDAILSDNVVVRALVLSIQNELTDVLKARVPVITDFELGRVEGMAYVEQFKRMGLSLKAWETLGPNPCEMCVENRSHGEVPLDFKYKSSFGDVLEPTAHSRCYCELTFSQDDLFRTFAEGNFSPWYGE